MLWRSVIGHLGFRGQMLAAMISVVVVAVLALGGALSATAWRQAERSAIAETRARAAHLAETITSSVNLAALSAREAVRFAASEAAQAAPARERLLRAYWSIAVGQPDLFGVWAQFKPNAFDGRDARFRGRLGSDGKGVFAPSWMRRSDGILVQDTSPAETAFEAAQKSDFYVAPIAARRLVILEPHKRRGPDGQEGVWMISAAAPVRVDSKIIGAAGVNVSLETLLLRLKAENAPEGEKAVLLSASGLIVAHEDRALLARPASAMGAPGDVLAAVLGPKPWSGVARIGDRTVLVASAPVRFKEAPQAGWTLVTFTPLDLVLAPARAAVLNTLGIGILLTAAAAIAAIFLGRRIGQPVDEMSGAMRAIAQGDLDAPIPPARPGTELGRMAGALAALKESRAARLSAEAANKAKDEFVAFMSHELRTPLTGVIGYSEILEEDLLALERADMARDARRIRTAARHLLAIINDVLDLSKIEAGRMEVNPAPADLALILEEVAETAAPLAEANSNRLECAIAPDLGVAMIDATRLRQCLLNLLSNACKFTEGGVVRLSARRETGAGEALVFSISDTGLGMSPAQVAKLFKPFVQADASTTRRFGGTGLGLAITRRLAQLMGGDVSVESALGDGSVFTLRLPARPVAPTPANEDGPLLSAAV